MHMLVSNYTLICLPFQVPTRALTLLPTPYLEICLSEQWQKSPIIENFTVHELAPGQRKHDVWHKVIYALESGDETTVISVCSFFTIFLVRGLSPVLLLGS